MRRLTFLLVSVLMIAAFSAFPFSEYAYACSCAVEAGATPRELAEDYFSRADAVFAGEVVQIEEPSPSTVVSSVAPVNVSLRTREVWKGPQQETLGVTTAVSSASCGFDFEEGEEYLVYASKDLEVSLCSGTKLLSDAAADLDVLGGDGPEEGELPDTSGATYGFFVAQVVLIGAIWLCAAFGAFAFVRRLLRRP